MTAIFPHKDKNPYALHMKHCVNLRIDTLEKRKVSRPFTLDNHVCKECSLVSIYTELR